MLRSNLFESVSSSSQSTSTPQPPVSPPWEDWELDATFLTALSDWDAKNPETTLQRVFQSASLAIDQNKDLVEVIPDIPFPARGLVKAVLQLVKLGATISGSQPELVGFAKDIIDWMDGVKASFVTAGSGNITKTTWENLARTRELIDEICMWATLRLRDRRWSLKNARINKEITDFKARLDYASKVFHNRSIIVISGGLDAILQKLGALLKSFDRISRTLKEIKNTQEEHYRAIIDELRDQQEAHNRQIFLETTLYPKTAEKVGYDQQEKIPCDEDTRIEVLAEIRAWINGVSYGSKNVLWLTGDPGCGKSAVTASVARECKDRKILWGQFFINRNNDETTNPNLYFPTIARQLAEYSDVVKRQIFNELTQKSSLLDGISREQATKLFVDALGAAASIDNKAPVVVVIDGLDETRRDKLEETAIIISTLFDALASYPNIKVFISSRTEHGIQRPFSKAIRDRRVKNIHLDTNAESSIRDVEIYLRKRFSQIAEKYGYNPNIWPGEGRLRFLVSHASGHFIWAVTVTKFLEEQMDEWGLERLDMVMGNVGTAGGKQDIKVLYGVILRLTYQRNRDPWASETFRRVVGAVATSLEPLSITQLEVLLDLKRDLHSSPVDLLHFVRRLRTVLVAGTGDITGDTILRLHKSFFEYITSNDCEDRFRVYLEASNAELAIQCLHRIIEAYSVVRDAQCSSNQLEMTQLPNSSQLGYSLRFCVSHFPKRGERSLGGLIDDPTVDPLLLNTMLSHSSGVDSGAGPLILGYSTNNDHIFTTLDDRDFYWHAKDGWFSHEISACFKPNDLKSKRLLCMAISPTGGTIAVAFKFIRSSSPRRDSRSRSEVQLLSAADLLPCLQSVSVMHTVESLVFSLDGRHIIVLTSNSIAKIDAETGDIILIEERIMRFRFDTSLAVSPDGSLHKIEISKTSPSVLVRSKIGSSSERVAMRHEAQCRFMVVSHDSTRILTITRYSVYLWDFRSGQMIGMFPADFDIWYAAISPDNEFVVCSDFFGTTYMRNIKISRDWRKLYDIFPPRDVYKVDFQSQSPSHIVWGAWFSPITSHFNFSPNGDLIVSMSHGIVYLWDRRSGRSSLLQDCNNSGPWSGPETELPTQCGVFSSNREHIFLFDNDRIRKQTVPPHHCDSSTPLKVEWTSFSPDGKFHLYSASEGGLCLCNLRTGSTNRLPFPKDNLKAQVQIVGAAFSTDASRIAGISNFGDVYMWDTAHHSILGVSRQPISSSHAMSILFAMDGATILLTSRTDSIIVARLSLVGGTLLKLPDQDKAPPISTRRRARIRYLHVDTIGRVYSSEMAPNSRLEKARWFPGPSNDSDVFYAYVKNHIVRGGADGTFVVVPVDAEMERRKDRTRPFYLHEPEPKA